MFDPPPFAGPVGAMSADLEEEEEDDDDAASVEGAGPSWSAVRRGVRLVARQVARRSGPYAAASGREGSSAGPSSWNQGAARFFGRSTGMVQPLAEGQLTPPPGWMRDGTIPGRMVEVTSRGTQTDPDSSPVEDLERNRPLLRVEAGTLKALGSPGDPLVVDLTGEPPPVAMLVSIFAPPAVSGHTHALAS